MADIDTALDVDLMHAQIVAQIQAAFPAFRTVEFYRDEETETMPTPAILLEISEGEPELGDDAGTGQLPAYLRFEARIIMGIRTPAVKLAVRKAAFALSAWLHLRAWGNGVKAAPCHVIACGSDEFDPRLDKWAVWRVEWRQFVMLGDSAWSNDGSVPDDWFSFAPDIGLGHEPDYQPAGVVLPL
ncbi:hypothetical protein [Paraburkholderia sp.]|uniref:hypothetical protein n=1 Tax=Paraburkholderia sp. TaxID=1926495 RepID=UPI002D559DDD|nr:hypothetical protein [Paraburkholderia sp.]HZZ03049.1 hypothetical protein [Paraburkholderia sp.]